MKIAIRPIIILVVVGFSCPIITAIFYEIWSSIEFGNTAQFLLGIGGLFVFSWMLASVCTLHITIVDGILYEKSLVRIKWKVDCKNLFYRDNLSASINPAVIIFDGKIKKRISGISLIQYKENDIYSLLTHARLLGATPI